MMKFSKKPSLRLAVFALVLSLISGSALADRYEWGERGQYRNQHNQHNQRYQKNNDRRYEHKKYQRNGAHYRFRDNDRQMVSRYYRDQRYKGQCPRGLSKKNNRCQASGKDKKWQRGKPLAKQTRYYDLPRGLRSRLSAPPEQYRYVRVDDDVLLIDAVTDVVVDVIENILR